MPAHALDPGPEWEVVDACAAPGNKTTHVAGVLKLHIASQALMDVQLRDCQHLHRCPFAVHHLKSPRSGNCTKI